ncbi:MAG TPA: insulinase family protein [Caulobacteraceae bacterium]|jgi:zinc protease|nr:insulinase family protein [Caulobacteraceae bacterium]
MISSRRRRLLASATLAFAICAGGVRAAPAAPARPLSNVWPQTYAPDLPPDPAMRFGTLPNGMRYVIMKNATPGGQASFRLRFAAGSMDESNAEQGLAHLLEHMSFDGSTHVPNGEMVKILERHGLAFGADTNASTSWEQTIYKLDLPKADEDTVDASLMLLRETASELTLSQQAIDKERGVVLSEERLRDTPGYRVAKASLQLDLQGQLAGDRFPIGLVEAVRNATRDQLEDIYTRYYRPERAVLVAVGDFDPDAMEAKIKARFGDWAPRVPAGPEPDHGKVLQRGAVTRLVVEPGAPPIVEMNWVQPPELEPDSKAKRRAKMIDNLALAVLNRRLDRLVRADDPPFLGASAARSDDFHSAEVTTVQTIAKPGEWEKALRAADQAVRQLVRYGVSADELGVEVDAYRATLKADAEGEATRTTPAVADDITETVDTPEVETSPSEDLALFEEDVKGLTPAQVDQALKTVFGGSGPLTLVSSQQPVDGGDKALADAFARIEAQPVAAPTAQAALSWPYDNFGTPGKVVDRQEVTDIDTVFVRFENGVRLTIKPTKFRDDQVLVQARVGRGELDIPSDRVTPEWSAGSAFPEGGLDQLSSQDIDQVLRSKIVGRAFTVTDDAFVLSGATKADDFETQVQLLAAYVAHPGWRPEGFDRMRAAAPSIFDQLEATPDGVLNRELGRLLHSGDPRWGIPDRAQIAAQTPAELKALLQDPIAKGPIEVVVVGDVNIDDAIEAVSDTFGALPAREPASADPATAIAFPAPTPAPIALTHKGRADQSIGLIAWPTDDFLSDTNRARKLSVLGAVMQLRLTEQLRKAESVTYSPSASSAGSSVFPHYGYLSARVEIPPGKLDDFFSDVAAITADLRDKPIGDDELERAKKPALDDLERRRETNEYWLNALAGAQTDPRRLNAIRTSIAQLQHVDAADVQQMAQTYLLDSKAWKLEVKPAAAP